jgi:amidophosphoribosyltransferase
MMITCLFQIRSCEVQPPRRLSRWQKTSVRRKSSSRVVLPQYGRSYHFSPITRFLNLLRRYSNVYGIDMPSRSELVAYDRTTEEIAEAIGADLVIFQKLPDLIASVRQLNPSIETFDCSVFTGEYVTGGVDEPYLTHIESLRADHVKNTTVPTDLKAVEAKGTNGLNGYDRPVTSSNAGANGTDDTVGLHNTWNVS